MFSCVYLPFSSCTFNFPDFVTLLFYWEPTAENGSANKRIDLYNGFSVGSCCKPIDSLNSCQTCQDKHCTGWPMKRDCIQNWVSDGPLEWDSPQQIAKTMFTRISIPTTVNVSSMKTVNLFLDCLDKTVCSQFLACFYFSVDTSFLIWSTSHTPILI